MQPPALCRVQIITINDLQLHLSSLGELCGLVDDIATVFDAGFERVHQHNLPYRGGVSDLLARFLFSRHAKLRPGRALEASLGP